MFCKHSSTYPRQSPTLWIPNPGLLTIYLYTSPCHSRYYQRQWVSECGWLSCCTLVSVVSWPATSRRLQLTPVFHTGFRAFAFFRDDPLLVFSPTSPVPKHIHHLPVFRPTNHSAPGLSRHWCYTAWTTFRNSLSQPPFASPTLFVRRTLAPVQLLIIVPSSKHGLLLRSLFNAQSFSGNHCQRYGSGAWMLR